MTNKENERYKHSTKQLIDNFINEAVALHSPSGEYGNPVTSFKGLHLYNGFDLIICVSFLPEGHGPKMLRGLNEAAKKYHDEHTRDIGEYVVLDTSKEHSDA
jgi:hypothetical protein